MNTAVISKSTIDRNNVTPKIKLDRLRISIKENTLYIKASSPVLTAFNHWVSLKNGILKIKVLPDGKLYRNTNALEIPIYIPRKEFNRIVEKRFENNTLYLEIEKQPELYLV